ncbi:MAG: hypothetical protein DRO76_02920 [Candidatus Altiarchaeales archaeon]|nr:MAG: hypothetical protein DRO76_02920 [Candidatus Altiarchaeales archaeon]
MDKETIKEFLKPDRVKLVLFLALLVLLFFFGFFRTSSCFLDENGIRVCRKCGLEGIFNPLLRPFSFIFANLVQGLIIEGDIALCGAAFAWFLYLPLDIIYLYFLSCLIILAFKKKRDTASDRSMN